jgi:LmbE family N-acetylglucosaminyl deacetylase
MNLIDKFNKVLVLCPHTDDEFGCAGIIIRLVEAGAKIKYIAFSRCEESVPDGLPIDTLEIECRKATRLLGIKDDNVEIDNFQVRYFPRDRQDLLERMVKINKTYAPDLVLLPCSQDRHQDHKVINEEGFRAFKFSTLLGYELPQNITTFSQTAFVKLSKEQIDKKIEAMSSYKSQNFRNYSSSEFIKGLAIVRGVQCNSEYAEAFEVIKLIID